MDLFNDQETTKLPPVPVKMEESWKEALQDEFSQPYFHDLVGFLKREKQAGKTIYPPGPLIFNAFKITPFEATRVVILGQDPYHNPGQAMGLSFSVPKNLAKPASLRNVYKELHNDVGASIVNHGDLTHWANQGVLLLNAMLTVEHKKAGSHRKAGWQKFTDAVIKTISDQREGIIFMLWGNFAKAKADLVDQSKHHVLKAAHPSPLAGDAFLGNQHFSTANRLLEQQGKTPIDWQLPS